MTKPKITRWVSNQLGHKSSLFRYSGASVTAKCGEENYARILVKGNWKKCCFLLLLRTATHSKEFVPLFSPEKRTCEHFIHCSALSFLEGNVAAAKPLAVLFVSLWWPDREEDGVGFTGIACQQCSWIRGRTAVGLGAIPSWLPAACGVNTLSRSKEKWANFSDVCCSFF